MSYRRKHRTFSSLSRRRRRKKVIHLKNIIRNERHRCGGIFYDECDLTPFEGETGRIRGWSDIFFTGSDAADLWNAEIITTQVAFREACHSRAFDEACDLLSEQERENEFKINTRPDYNSRGKIISHTLLHREPCKHGVFGGLTFWEFVEKREAEIAVNDPPAVYCGYDFLPGYAYGFGLRMVVDAPSLSQQVIEEAIADFRRRGECEWHAAEAVSFPLSRD